MKEGIPIDKPIRPFFQWRGGKRQLLKKMRPHLPVSFNRYYEPFLGGGAMLLDLQPERAYINDVHPLVYQAFLDLCDPNKAKAIEKSYFILQDAYTPLSIPERKEKVKEYLACLNARLRASQDVTELFLFLTRNCFCAKFAQMKNGDFSCSWGQYAPFDAANYERAASYLQMADLTITNRDYSAALVTAGEGDFVFLDPPYSRPTTTTFINYNAATFKDDEQERLAAVFRDLDAKGVQILETNYDTPETRHLYDGFEFIPFENKTHIGVSANYAQVMIRNYTN